MGKWLRNRYNSLMSEVYNRNDIYIFSSDEDRCLMTAQCVLAGMFQPSARISTNAPEVLKLWEPVPVHTKPKDEDPYLAMSSPCPRWDEDYENLKKEAFYTNLLGNHSNLLEYISNNTGWKKLELDNFRYLHKVLNIYNEHYSSYVPSWAQSLGKADLKTIQNFAGMAYALQTYTTTLKRLSAGPFINKLLYYIDRFVKRTDPFKILMLSGHGSTLAAVLNAMGCFDNVPPEFSATVLWEVYRQSCDKVFVRLFYLKSPDTMTLVPLNVKGCNFDCDYLTFKELLGPYDVSDDVWRKECNS